MLRFTKMNGAGNDFVMIDNRAGEVQLTTAQIAKICDRHRGVGADGILADRAGEQQRRFSDALLQQRTAAKRRCAGTGRVASPVLPRRSLVPGKNLSFETPAGVIAAHLHGELVTL